MTVVGFTSVVSGPPTARSVEFLRQHGMKPILISERANRSRLKKYMAPDDFANAVIVSSFKHVERASEELERALDRRRLKLTNWINITDDTTAFFLRSCDRLGLKFEFRTPYEQCRIKPLAR